jgi:hypothetical protein
LKNYMKIRKECFVFMKRFFALFTIVALLAVTGSAFAANPTVTANPSSVTITVGGREEVAITATAGNTGGTLGAFGVTGDSGAGASITGSAGSGTLTLAPTTTGSFTVTVNVTETYTTSDAAGHPSQQTATGSVTVSVTVNDVYQGDPVGSETTGMLDAEVPQAAVNALASQLGGSVKQLGTDANVTTNNSGATPGQTDSNGNVCLGLFPSISNLSDGTYLVSYTFPAIVPSNVEGGLSLSVNGKTVSVKIFDMSYVELDATAISGGETVYLAFTVRNDDIVDASLGDVNAAFDLVDPLLVASKSSSGTNNPGSSSGGCDAGFTALALAVLGGFIATRRK